MRLLWKKLQFGVFAGLTVLVTGCGGLTGTYRVTPLSFLLPGLVKANSKPANAEKAHAMEDCNAELAQTENAQTNF